MDIFLIYFIITLSTLRYHCWEISTIIIFFIINFFLKHSSVRRDYKEKYMYRIESKIKRLKMTVSMMSEEQKHNNIAYSIDGRLQVIKLPG